MGGGGSGVGFPSLQMRSVCQAAQKPRLNVEKCVTGGSLVQMGFDGDSTRFQQDSLAAAGFLVEGRPSVFSDHLPGKPISCLPHGDNLKDARKRWETGTDQPRPALFCCVVGHVVQVQRERELGEPTFWTFAKNSDQLHRLRSRRRWTSLSLVSDVMVFVYSAPFLHETCVTCSKTTGCLLAVCSQTLVPGRGRHAAGRFYPAESARRLFRFLLGLCVGEGSSEDYRPVRGRKPAEEQLSWFWG